MIPDRTLLMSTGPHIEHMVLTVGRYREPDTENPYQYGHSRGWAPYGRMVPNTFMGREIYWLYASVTSWVYHTVQFAFYRYDNPAGVTVIYVRRDDTNKSIKLTKNGSTFECFDTPGYFFGDDDLGKDIPISMSTSPIGDIVSH